MPPKEDAEFNALKKEIEALKETIKGTATSNKDKTLEELSGSLGDPPRVKLSTKKTLKGHIHKVNCVDFAGDNRHLVSASLDGKLIVWDTWTGNKVQIIPLRSSWVMSCCFAKSGNFVASGGMDNMATVHDLNNRDSSGAAKVIRELAGYDGFLSSCKFVDDRRLLTGSGDMKICQWDLESGKRTLELYGHAGDVVTLSLCPGDENIFVTGSVDQTSKLWDLRQKSFVQSFWGHTSDVNSVCFHPSSLAFASASEDKTARFFDLRADQQLGQYQTPGTATSFTCCTLSKSGRHIIAGCDDSTIHAFDMLKTTHLGSLSGHENRITSLSMTDSGLGLASSSWDQHVRIWI
ncbi:unnamed protein product [Allacma fusca]|uniref:Guanine nucleotide-binding protein subunit beta-2 n=1 Tax=Allacma fusca TaxID=39272 RepID=A0A8J2L8C6_9HEXA|nr:unnamed protein product [Allacma fusca]